MPFYVYKLVNPKNHIPFYIGITDDTERRHFEHLLCTGDNKAKIDTIQQLLDEGIEPPLEIIESREQKDEARARERYWILHYISQGIELTNIQSNPHSQQVKTTWEDILTDEEKEILDDIKDQWRTILKVNGYPKGIEFHTHMHSFVIATGLYGDDQERNLAMLWHNQYCKEHNITPLPWKLETI